MTYCISVAAAANRHPGTVQYLFVLVVDYVCLETYVPYVMMSMALPSATPLQFCDMVSLQTLHNKMLRQSLPALLGDYPCHR